MKKILLILVLCLTTIGLTGCGNKLPNKVELTPENNYTAIVGQDLREGKEYYIVVEDYNKDDVEKVRPSKEESILSFYINDEIPPIHVTINDLLNVPDNKFKKRINVTNSDKVKYNNTFLRNFLGETNTIKAISPNMKIYIVSE